MGFYFMKNEHFSHSGIIDIAKHYLTSLEIGMRSMGNIFNKNVMIAFEMLKARSERYDILACATLSCVGGSLQLCQTEMLSCHPHPSNHLTTCAVINIVSPFSPKNALLDGFNTAVLYKYGTRWTG